MTDGCPPESRQAQDQQQARGEDLGQAQQEHVGQGRVFDCTGSTAQTFKLKKAVVRFNFFERVLHVSLPVCSQEASAVCGRYSNSNIEPAALQLSGKVQVEPARRRDEEGKMEQALALAEARHGGALVAGSST
jgi:hypothetical protein